MQNLITGMNWVGAVGIGALTFVVSRRVLKVCPVLDSPVVAFCVAALTATSLGGSGVLSGVLLPYGALGLSLFFIFLILPFLKAKKLPKEKSPVEDRPSPGKEDPWEKELRRRSELSRRRQSR